MTRHKQALSSVLPLCFLDLLDRVFELCITKGAADQPFVVDDERRH